jgi:predicted YcjX-like family ATPase
MLRFASVAGSEVLQPYALHAPGDVFTETLLTVHGQRVLVSAFGGTTGTPQDVQDVQQALDQFLASIRM